MFGQEDSFDPYFVEKEGCCLKNFKLFTIMDMDDCTEQVKEQYKSAALFDGLWLQEYIVPVYHSPSIEHVLFECGLIDKIYKGKEKMKNYRNIFPIAHGNASNTNLEEIQKLYDMVLHNKNTNLEVFLDYCI